MDREVEALAKETMLAVDRAEQQAQETVRHAQEEAQRLRQDAAAKGQQLIEAAEKEAQKRAGILYGVAKADGEKRKGRHPAGMPRGTGTAAGPGPLPARAGGPGRGTDRAGPSQKEVSAYGCGAHETPGALCPAAG